MPTALHGPWCRLSLRTHRTRALESVAQLRDEATAAWPFSPAHGACMCWSPPVPVRRKRALRRCPDSGRRGADTCQLRRAGGTQTCSCGLLESPWGPETHSVRVSLESSCLVAATCSWFHFCSAHAMQSAFRMRIMVKFLLLPGDTCSMQSHVMLLCVLAQETLSHWEKQIQEPARRQQLMTRYL